MCLKFVSDLPIARLRKLSKRAGARPARVAGIRRLAVIVSLVLGLFAGPHALAATLTVTSLADTTGSCSGGSCPTLRAAITQADSDSSTDLIVFTGLSGAITLTSPLPAISRNMNIAGPGANLLTISGGNAYQIFNISSSSAIVNISGLTFANGSAPNGGAIGNSGTLTVTNSTFSGNSAQGGTAFGGAIFSQGLLTVTNSTFSGNSAGQGGAILNTNMTTVTNSTFSGNSAGNSGGAILANGPLTVTDSTFSGNSAHFRWRRHRLTLDPR
jgi:predicted outer membrane repeat protein